ncbi:hypothetical protein FRX31_030448 [Thalictrum thalictroides]|uniref:Uncharacterized protein n=1 Tax=Thalictrum thalictroides TaxID=46969 RepID=A0A7J6V4R4_THATH|nr:hypothetical protein FRX31_030448 [Thalictrum thalictroides]
MAHVKKVNVEDKSKSKSLIEGVSSSTPKLPPATLPKFNTSSKIRPHSAVKLAPEPQFVTTSSNPKISSTPNNWVATKKQSGRGSKGKEVTEVFAPSPFMYLGPNGEGVSVMTNDSAFKDPLVSRAVNEGTVLGADASVVQKQTEQQVRDLTQVLVVKKNEANVLAKTLAEEQNNHNNHRLTYEAWKARCDDLTSQLNDLGSPEEGETQEMEDPAVTPKDSLIGPVESTDPVIMQTD